MNEARHVGQGRKVAFTRAWLCGVVLMIAGCTWSPEESDATLKHFKDHAGDYQALLDSVKESPSGDYSRYETVLKSIEVSAGTPSIVEVTPISFYYVLVHVDDAALLTASDAMADEGRMLKNLGNGWFLVQRGYM